MRSKWLLLALPVAAAVWGGPVAAPAHADICLPRGRRCSTPPPRPGAPKALIERTLAGPSRLAPGERIVVPIVYHLVYDSYVPVWEREEPDDLEHAPPVALVHRQTRALNRAFRVTRFSFRTQDAQLRSFARWRTVASVGQPASADVIEMIRELNAERPGALHVFLLRNTENRAAPPDVKDMYDLGQRSRGTDGVVMNWDYLPYVEALHPVADPDVPRLYFQGDTLVHLVGHYLGLLHTFEPWPDAPCAPPCAQITDHVRDTPVHRPIQSAGCRPLDSCKDFPGMDPVTNFMNFETDVCASEFTPGQVERMERMVRLLRPHLIVPVAANTP